MSLQLKRHIGTNTDPRGSLIDEYAEPVDINGFVAPRTGVRGASREDDRAGYENRTITALTLYRYEVDIKPKDRVLVDGDEFEVEGLAFDHAKWNPLSNFGGKQVGLSRVEG